MLCNSLCINSSIFALSANKDFFRQSNAVKKSDFELVKVHFILPEPCGGLQGLVEIFHQILGILQADREADEAAADARRGLMELFNFKTCQIVRCEFFNHLLLL